MGGFVSEQPLRCGQAKSSNVVQRGRHASWGGHLQLRSSSRRVQSRQAAILLALTAPAVSK